MSIDNIKFITNIYQGCYESYPCQHKVEYVNQDNEICTKLLSGKLIWNF